MSKPYINVTQKEIDSWIELNSYHGIENIASMTGRNHKTIRFWFKKAGFQWDTHLYRKYTKLQIEGIHQEYMGDSNISLLSICRKYSITQGGLLKRFEKYGLATKDMYTVSHKKINDDFFSSIDSEIKAYLLGFFVADGHIERRDDCNTYCLKVGIARKDIEILDLFNKYVANNQCKISLPKSKPNMCSIGIHSRQIGEDLKLLGYDNRKTYTSNSLPDIDRDLMRHFVRGYFDGDGSITLYKRTRGWNRRFNLCAFSPQILDEIVSLMPLRGGKVYRRSEEDVEKLIQGKRAFFKGGCSIDICDCINLVCIYDYLYKDSTYSLKRKHDKFKLTINTMKKTNSYAI